jgi:hypothetical protein
MDNQRTVRSVTTEELIQEALSKAPTPVPPDTYACDVYHRWPLDAAFFSSAVSIAEQNGGWLDSVDRPGPFDGVRCCLTLEFRDERAARNGAAALAAGNDGHVEGPYSYG